MASGTTRWLQTLHRSSSPVAAGSRGARCQPRRSDDAVPHAHARRGGPHQIDDRPCSCGHQACKASCGAAPEDRPLGYVAGLYLPAHRRPIPLAYPAPGACSVRVAAVFRLILLCGSSDFPPSSHRIPAKRPPKSARSGRVADGRLPASGQRAQAVARRRTPAMSDGALLDGRPLGGRCCRGDWPRMHQTLGGNAQERRGRFSRETIGQREHLVAHLAAA